MVATGSADSQGYHVKALVRSNKSNVTHIANIENVEIIPCTYSIKALVPILKGVGKVIHTASPLIYTSKNPEKEILEPTINTLEAVIEACIQSQVEKLVVTSSLACLYNRPSTSSEPVTEASWNDTSTLETSPYVYSKVKAEQMAWKMVESTSLQLVCVLPGLIMGPLPANWTKPSPKSNYLPRQLDISSL